MSKKVSTPESRAAWAAYQRERRKLFPEIFRERERRRYERDRERIRERQSRRDRSGDKIRQREIYASSPLKQTKTIWIHMIERCGDPSHDAYKYYGAEGIHVCDRWLESFDNFVEDMGLRPPKLTLDRRNGREGYSKDNCRWATLSEQMKNRRLAIHQVPSCTCGSCKRCRQRESQRRSRERRKLQCQLAG